MRAFDAHGLPKERDDRSVSTPPRPRGPGMSGLTRGDNGGVQDAGETLAWRLTSSTSLPGSPMKPVRTPCRKELAQSGSKNRLFSSDSWGNLRSLIDPWKSASSRPGSQLRRAAGWLYEQV